MSDYLKRAFRAQVTTTMESLLRRAVFEIMTVFENSIHDHQMELAHKGEEVVQLKIKLQTAELKLRERECLRDGGAAVDEIYLNETRRQAEAIHNTTEQTSDVPEIDVEVPDDWCAPLGCETVTKRNEEGCPSVRLRPLSIPLWHVPVKQEEGSYHIDFDQEKKGRRRSNKASSSNKKHNNSQHRSLRSRETKSRISFVRSDKKLLQDAKPQYSDGLGLRSGNRREKRGKTKRGKQEIKLMKLETEKSDDEKIYRCRFCEKVFDTAFGRTVHVRSHKRCAGCKKDFPFPSTLEHHKPSCVKFKELLAERAQRVNVRESDFCGEKNALLSHKKVTIKQELSSDSGNTQSSVQNDAVNKMPSYTFYQRQFTMRRKLKKPRSHHTAEKYFACSRCPKKFHIIKGLRSHITKMHKDQLSEPNGDLTWTKPLEDTEMKRSPSQASSSQPVSDRQKKCPHVCKVCGKGFFYHGSLLNHMRRLHR